MYDRNLRDRQEKALVDYIIQMVIKSHFLIPSALLIKIKLCHFECSVVCKITVVVYSLFCRVYNTKACGMRYTVK